MPGELLVAIGRERFNSPERHSVHLLDDVEQNDFLNDIENIPHAYVLACLMDRQIRAERAWAIPYKIKQVVNSFAIDALALLSCDDYTTIFENNKLHRFNETMAKVFHSGVLRIKNTYSGDASSIWRNNPSSAKVVYEFMQFDGSGIKIATMAANILARQFKIPFSDFYSIDISPDVHVLRVMRRTGIVPHSATIDQIVYKARELNPEFPGIIDYSCWEIGREWCKSQNPRCADCIITERCRKHIWPCDRKRIVLLRQKSSTSMVG